MKVLLNNFSYYRNNNISPKQTFKGGANINGLYTKEDWNGIYRSGQILPWTKRGWTDVSIECIKPYISTEDEKILDYGCGSGAISKFLAENGHKVIASDISDAAVEMLKSSKDITFDVIQAAHPNQINERNFNSIICMGVFHHINPEHWFSFLKDFSDKLVTNGKLIISGWDKNDSEFINTPDRVSKVTKNRTWFINSLDNKEMLEKLNLVLEDSKLVPFIEPGYNKSRLIRCFKFRKIV